MSIQMPPMQTYNSLQNDRENDIEAHNFQADPRGSRCCQITDPCALSCGTLAIIYGLGITFIASLVLEDCSVEYERNFACPAEMGGRVILGLGIGIALAGILCCFRSIDKCDRLFDRLCRHHREDALLIDGRR